MARGWVFSLFLLLCCSILSRCKSQQQDFTTCDNTLVQVTSLETACDVDDDGDSEENSSSYSSYCNYGDYLNISVTFDVVSYLDDEGDDIYLQLAVYSPENDDQLYQGDTNTLCSHFDLEYGGCVNPGAYGFSARVQLQNSNNGQEYNFAPVVKLYFSLEENGGSDLGGANIGDCDDDSDNGSGWNWTNPFLIARRRKMAGLFLIIIGMALGAGVAAYFIFVWARYLQCCNRVEIEPDDDDMSFYTFMRSGRSFVTWGSSRYHG